LPTKAEREDIERRLKGGETAPEIAKALGVRLRQVRTIADSLRRETTLARATSLEATIEAVVRDAPPLEAASVADVSRATRDELVRVQARLLAILDRSSILLYDTLTDGDAHRAQQLAIVVGVTVDQVKKVLREIRDLVSESQDAIETSWVTVVRDEEDPSAP